MVALITPFTKTNDVDYDALKVIIGRLMQEGVDGFIVCGTTAETPTLSVEERFSILSFVEQETKHQVAIWFGCGSNDTQTTIQLCKEAQNHDIDGVLLVTPYYNRPSQEGIYQHFYTIAHSIQTDIMLYNIPSRCCVELQASTIIRLLDSCDNIKALKQASRDMECVRIVKEQYPAFLIYSGEDGFLDEGMDAGMDGIISVMGHCNLPLINAFLLGNRNDNQMRKRLNMEASLVFMEPSPSCIKYLLSKKGECRNHLRLPMTCICDHTKAILDEYDGF